MVLNCSICSESLEKGPGENPNESVIAANAAGNSNLSAAPCGHIFHTFCINKWMAGGLATSNRCPCCRKIIGRNKCIALFPDSYDESFAEAPGSSSPSVTVRSVVDCNHGPEINTLKTEVRSLTTELDQQRQLYEMQAEDFKTINDKYQHERHVSQSYALKYKQCESYKDAYHDLTANVKSLEEMNSKYKYIKLALEGVKQETRDDLKNFCVDEESIRTLIDVKHLLQNELASSQRKLDEKKKESEQLRSLSLCTKVKIRDLEKLNKELKNVNQILRQKVDSMNTSMPSPGSSSTPTPKRKYQEDVSSSYKPLSMKYRRAMKKDYNPVKETEKTILVEDSSQESDVDEDVGVFQPFKKVPAKKSRKRESSTQSERESDGEIILSKKTRNPNFAFVKPKKMAQPKGLVENFSMIKYMTGKSNIPGVSPISPLVLSNKKNLK